MPDLVQRKNGPLAERATPRVLERRPTLTPRADIVELPEELLLLLDLPGVKAEDVDVHFERGELTVLGRVMPPEGTPNLLVAEYEVGDFHRVFLVSQEVASDQITAELKGGVLTLHLPKAESARARRITVQGESVRPPEKVS